MDRSTLRGHSVEKDVHQKDTKDAVNKLQKTEVDGVRVSDQVGPIHSKLGDVESLLRDKKHRVLDSAAKAVAEDASVVQGEEKKAEEQRRDVEVTARDTAIDQRKAESAKTSDRRILDGSEMAGVLQKATSELNDIAKTLSSVEAMARENRTKSKARMDDAVSRNKK